MLWYRSRSDRLPDSGSQLHLFLLTVLVYTVPLTVRASPVGCPSNTVNLVARNDQQTIQSPNFPKSYQDNMLCKWKITAGSDEVIRIQVTSLAVDGRDTCPGDYLDALDGPYSYSNGIKRYCGDEPNGLRVETSTSSTILIVFKTDNKVTSKGFQMTFWAVPRGEIRYLPVTWGLANRILMGVFGLIVSSIIVSMVTIFFALKVPCIQKRLHPGKSVTRPADLRQVRANGNRLPLDTRENSFDVSSDTLCESSRTISETHSISTLTTPC